MIRIPLRNSHGRPKLDLRGGRGERREWNGTERREWKGQKEMRWVGLEGM